MILFTKEKQYLPIVNAAAQRYSVQPALIFAHIKQESGFNSQARLDEKTSSGTVWDSSYGLMQLLLRTAQSLDPNATVEKLLNPSYNIDLGTKYIAKNLDRYKNNLKDSIAAYNAGSAMKDDQGRYVNTKGVPNVQTYVDRVYSNYQMYSKWLGHGGNTFDITTVNPYLAVGFAAVLLITIIGGGAYVGKRRRKMRRIAA